MPDIDTTILVAANPWSEEDQMTREFVDAHQAMVTRTAKQQHKGAIMFDADDLEQSIWVHMLENWARVRDCTAYQVKGFAYRAAAKWCQQQRLNYMEFTGAFVYTPADVRSILSTSVWVDVHIAEDVEGRVDMQRTLGKLTAADRALEKLTEDQHRVILKSFRDGETLERNEQKQLSKAIDAIAKELNAGLSLTRETLETAALHR